MAHHGCHHQWLRGGPVLLLVLLISVMVGATTVDIIVSSRFDQDARLADQVEDKGLTTDIVPLMPSPMVQICSQEGLTIMRIEKWNPAQLIAFELIRFAGQTRSLTGVELLRQSVQE